MRDPELQEAVEKFLHMANRREHCIACSRTKGQGHAQYCMIAKLNAILNSRVPRIPVSASEPK